jgi:diadenosine tetraphosphate (Ap4A) HIT family hydrolase
MSITEQVAAARAGREPALISRVSSGWVVLCRMQFLRGYSILLPDPVVVSLNDLTCEQRASYLCDMSLVGDALLEVTGCYRINYAIMGNSEPLLHAHIVPRYLGEPDELRSKGSWSYPQETIDSILFDSERDKGLMRQLCEAIGRRSQVESVNV